MFERVLVANRGEIARRIVRTCRRLGIATVAVHSAADVDEPHVHEADTAVCIGPAPAAQSYLDIERLVAAALDTGCEAVHPGYGFLAENAAFADAAAAAGLTFVGPSPEVIRLMGDKAAAKRHLAAAGVPVIAGEDSGALSDTELTAAGTEIGVPLLVKAVAGGGGKGMRTVRHLDDLPDALAAARREAGAAFGDDRLILERLVPRPRHVEVQVIGDTHGTVLHLGERECSIQRRHQKLVEEAPSPALDEALRGRMTTAAVTAAQAVGYEGAGTVEFLVAGDTVDTAQPEFAFLEVNTRLQVEHPVTELVTGRDLVELQLRVAAGEPLGFTQDDVGRDGHAIEVRLYAEDPVRHLPQTGSILRFDVPSGPGLRVDSGVERGSAVTPHYDPLLAKLVAHGPDRDTARARLADLLRATVVHGVVTNLPLLAAVIDHDRFRAGDLTTHFLDEHLDGWSPPNAGDIAWTTAASALTHRLDDEVEEEVGPWAALGPIRPTGTGGWPVQLSDGAETRTLRVVARPTGDDVRHAGRHHLVRPSGQMLGSDGASTIHVDGAAHEVVVTVEPEPANREVVWVHAAGRTERLEVIPIPRPAHHVVAGSATFGSPMPGSVLSIAVSAGQHVAAGATLAVVEAMKMEHPVVAPAAGTVTAVHATVGDAVEAGASLVDFTADTDDDGDDGDDDTDHDR